MLRRVSAAAVVFASIMLVAAGCSGGCSMSPDGQSTCENETNWPAIIGVIAGLVVVVGGVILLVVLLTSSSRKRKARRDQELHQVLQGPPAFGGAEQPPAPGMVQPPGMQPPQDPGQPAPGMQQPPGMQPMPPGMQPPPGQPDNQGQWWPHGGQTWDGNQQPPTAQPPAPPTMTPPEAPPPDSTAAPESAQDQRSHWDVPPQW